MHPALTFLFTNICPAQKIRYIHNNPVEAGLVFRAEEYMFSSAIDYCGEKGLLGGAVLVAI